MQTTATATAQRSADRRLLVLAVILGVIAAGLIVAYLRSLSSTGESGPPTLSVVVARQDIPAGTKITEGMVEMKALPEAAVLPGALTAKEQVVGQTARYPIVRGEQVSNLRLVEPPKVPAISFQIPPGLRGFTIPVQVQRSPAALLVPGDFVDVLASIELRTLGLPTPAGQQTNEDLQGAVTLIQNAQVLAVQRQYVEGGVPYDPAVRGTLPKESNITYVTLAVTPEQAQLLTLAIEKAKLLTLSLRPFGDDGIKELPPVVEPLRLR